MQRVIDLFCGCGSVRWICSVKSKDRAAKCFLFGTLLSDQTRSAAVAAERRQHGIYFEERLETFPRNCWPRLEALRKYFIIRGQRRNVYTRTGHEVYLPRITQDFRTPEAGG